MTFGIIPSSAKNISMADKNDLIVELRKDS